MSSMRSALLLTAVSEVGTSFLLLAGTFKVMQLYFTMHAANISGLCTEPCSVCCHAHALYAADSCFAPCVAWHPD